MIHDLAEMTARDWAWLAGLTTAACALYTTGTRAILRIHRKLDQDSETS